MSNIHPTELALSLTYAERNLDRLHEDVADLAKRLGRKQRDYAEELRYVINTRARLADALSAAAQRSAVAES